MSAWIESDSLFSGLFKVISQWVDKGYLKGALLVSLLSVWVLVVLFYYLNRYTKRRYFTIWTVAWLFYALWLTLGISFDKPEVGDIVFAIKQWCIGVSAVFLLWGGLQFLGKPVWQSQFGWFMLFMLIWSFLSPDFLRDIDGKDLLVQIPVFSLVGFASVFAGASFYKLRKKRNFVGVGLLFLGFVLWGLYLFTYPFTTKKDELMVVGFLVSAVLQLFIAVSMIVLVLEEARFTHEQIVEEIEKVKSEKQELQMRVFSVQSEPGLQGNLQQAYDELRQTQHSVVQRERLLALGQMSSGMAHDINNAISPILGFSELLLAQDSGMPEPARKHLSFIRLAAQDIAQMVARMSDFYRRRDQTEPLRPVDVNRLVREVVEMTRPRWRDMAQSQGINVQVVTEYTEKLPRLNGNDGELREGLTNILLNSVDALPKGGTITVSTKTATLNANAKDGGDPDHIIIEIRDNGVGMDEVTRRRCFEPFYSTKQQRGGTGLGLAMVYGMMERHDGQIQVQSELGVGTTMQLIFPVRQYTPLPDQAATELIARSGLRVLCVDDEPLLREMLREILVHQKNQVVTADNGQNALEKFSAAKTGGKPFDVVITDLGMPDLDGRELAQKIKSISPGTPVIMLTGWGKVLEEKLGACEAVDIAISKPPRIKEIAEAIAKVMAKRKDEGSGQL